MRGVSIIAGGAGGWGSHPFRRFRQNGRQRDARCSSSSAASGAGPSGRASYFEKVAGLGGPLKAALTSASLSALGDVGAQALIGKVTREEGGQAPPYDPSRTLRMFGYGFTWYGPCQFYWYNLLDWMLPVKNTANFLTKVAANQLILAPATLSTVFAWNLALTGQAEGIPAKIKNDLIPNMMNGWKFWIPAASVNFYCIPLKYQVLYMSACGILWTAYLSYASNMPAKPAPVALAEPVEDKKGKGKKK